MLSENDLISKIAEYRCKDSITESDCVKLAAFITVRDCLYPPYEDTQYSFASSSKELHPEDHIVEYESGSEFFKIAGGMRSDKVWQIVDELMDTLQVINPRLYAGVIRKLEEG